MKADKIAKKAKINVYYLILFWSARSVLEQRVLFTDRETLVNIAFVCNRIRRKKMNESKQIQKLTREHLTKVNTLSQDIDELSFEMLLYISLNYLVVEIEDLKITCIDSEYILSVLESMKFKYGKELKQHYKLFDAIDDNIKE